MHLGTTCLFAKNARDCLSPKHNRSKQWKFLLLATFESVLPIISEPQGALLLCSPSSVGFAPFSATHPLLDLAKHCSHPFSSSRGNHLWPKICLQIRPWQGWQLLLFQATSLQQWLTTFTHKKRDIWHPLAFCKAVICYRPMTQLKAAINSSHVKETPLLEYVQSGFLSQPSTS